MRQTVNRGHIPAF